MKITTEQELQPFQVPNYVLTVKPPQSRQEGFREGPKYHLSELSDDVLESLCKRFRDDVFAKARGTSAAEERSEEKK
jgi:hypothetical protein